MASAPAAAGNLDYAPLVLQIRAGRYVNRTLQLICGAEGLKQAGVKADLQNRIIESECLPSEVVAASSPAEYFADDLCFGTKGRLNELVNDLRYIWLGDVVNPLKDKWQMQ